MMLVSLCWDEMLPFRGCLVHSLPFLYRRQGGSWISTGDEASRFARFSFRRHFFQHMGFRLVRVVSQEPTPVRLCKNSIFVLGLGVTGNPLTVQQVDSERSLLPSTNTQFEWDCPSRLREAIQQEVGEVSV